MKVIRVAMAVIWAAGASVAAWGQAPSLEGLDLVLDVVPAGPVALVHNRPIPSEAFVELYTSELNRYQLLRPDDTISDAFRIGLALRCMRILIEKEVLLQEAEKRNVTLTDEYVQGQWAKEVEMLGQQLAGEHAEPLSEDEVLKRAGATREEALTELRKALMIEKIREIIAKEKGVEVTDKEVKQQYEQMHEDNVRQPDRAHLRQIFLRAPRQNDNGAEAQRQEARKKAEDALSRIQSGRKFDAVAKEVSDEPFRSKGGDLGTARIDTMPDFMAEAARTLKPGEMSGVIESDFGYHIIELLELLPGEEITFEKAAPYIKSTLLLQKTNHAVEEFCREATDDKDAIQTALNLDRKLITHPELLDMLDPGAMPEEMGMSPRP